MRRKGKHLGASIGPSKLGGETDHRHNRILLGRRYHRRHLLFFSLVNSSLFRIEAEGKGRERLSKPKTLTKEGWMGNVLSFNLGRLSLLGLNDSVSMY